MVCSPDLGVSSENSSARAAILGSGLVGVYGRCIDGNRAFVGWRGGGGTKRWVWELVTGI